MSWLDLPSLISRLSEVVGLLREQNALTRELIQAQTGRPARTPETLSVASRLAPTRSAAPRQPPRTAADTCVMTAADYVRQEIEAEKASRRGPGEPMPPAERPPASQPIAAPPPPSPNPD